MANEEGVESGKELTNWEEKMAAEAREASKVERPGMSTISLRAGVMTYMDEAIPNNTLDCIVLTSAIEQSWYSQDFDPDRIVPPDCFALGAPGQEQALAPHEVVPVEQRQSETCVTCEKFKWGSGRGRGKACGTRRRLVLIPKTALDDTDTLPAAEMAVLKVPVTSVRNWSNYVNNVAAQHNRPVWGIITSITCKPDPKTQFKVMFSPSDLVDVSVLPHLQGLIQQAQTVAYAPFDMSMGAEDDEEEGDTKKKKY